MTTAALAAMPLVKVPFDALDESWVGEQLLVTTRRSDGAQTHFGGLSDIEPSFAVFHIGDSDSCSCPRCVHVVRIPVLVLFLGGERVPVTAHDVIVAAPTPTALDVEPDYAASPYDDAPGPSVR